MTLIPLVTASNYYRVSSVELLKFLLFAVIESQRTLAMEECSITLLLNIANRIISSYEQLCDLMLFFRDALETNLNL